jgi:hypothetical protein
MPPKLAFQVTELNNGWLIQIAPRVKVLALSRSVEQVPQESQYCKDFSELLAKLKEIWPISIVEDSAVEDETNNG